MTILQKGNKGAAKLTPTEVTEIRRLYGEGYTQSSISKHFRVAVGTIGRIVRGESWLEGAGARELTVAEHEGIQRRTFALQEQLQREQAFEAGQRVGELAWQEENAQRRTAEAVPVKPISAEALAARNKLLGYALESKRASPPPSLLDGGDAPAEVAGQGLARLEEAAQTEGLDVEVALRRGGV